MDVRTGTGAGVGAAGAGQAAQEAWAVLEGRVRPSWPVGPLVGEATPVRPLRGCCGGLAEVLS